MIGLTDLLEERLRPSTALPQAKGPDCDSTRAALFGLPQALGGHARQATRAQPGTPPWRASSSVVPSVRHH